MARGVTRLALSFNLLCSRVHGVLSTSESQALVDLRPCIPVCLCNLLLGKTFTYRRSAPSGLAHLSAGIPLKLASFKTAVTKRLVFSIVPKTVVFGTRLTPLQNACAFSHLYPTPLHLVVGRITTMSVEAYYALRVPGFYSPS